jgi:hypothetical protein
VTPRIISEAQDVEGKPEGSSENDVLAAGIKTMPFGFRIGGARVGPTLLVAGYAPIASAVFERLAGLPTLGWMRGTLVLVMLDSLDVRSLDDHSFEDVGHIDRIFHLPYAASGGKIEVQAHEGYWSVLRLCTELGMISGRGVAS